MIPYKSYRYIYPPRPEDCLPASDIPEYDNGTYIAQPKWNGDCMLIFTNGIETHVRDRHNKEFKKVLSPKLLPQLKKLHRESAGEPRNKWMCVVGEYMIKSKKDHAGMSFNEKFVIFDIIVFDGRQLIGQTFLQRQELLVDLYGMAPGHDRYMYATDQPDVFRAKYFHTSFNSLFNELVVADMYEGLILKMADAPLENGITQKNNSATQVKFRKPHKNYAY